VRRLVLAGLLLCSPALEVMADGQKLKVLTSFAPIYCLVANVAGDLAQIDNLLPGNAEPHDYQFSRKDLQRVSHADLIVLNGLGLETWLQKVLTSSARVGPAIVVEIGAGMDSELIHSPAGEAGDASGKSTARPNPHIWLDPQLTIHAVANISKALQKADPAHAGGYAANAAQFTTRLAELDADLLRDLAPLKGAAIVTYHDAFPYFARRYGLNIVGVIERVPDVEPSLKYLAALYGSIRANHVRAIFVDTSSRSRLAEQIGCDLHLPVAALDTLETAPLKLSAYEDAMRSNELLLLKYLKTDAQTHSR